MTSRFLKKILCLLLFCGMCTMKQQVVAASKAEPVDYVNPYMGNISHLLVPTYPIVHLPNSMLRVYPQRGDYTSGKLHGLPVLQISHRGSFVFNLSPLQGDETDLARVMDYNYDNEVVKPYYYKVDLCDQQLHVDFAPSRQSAIYHFDYRRWKWRTDSRREHGLRLSEYMEQPESVHLYGDGRDAGAKRCVP